MVLLESINLKPGIILPNFTLNTPTGDAFSNTTLMGKKGLLIMFTCNHCPYALAVWDRFITIANQSKTLDINAVAINPNIHPDYPADSPENMIKFVAERKFSFPYLVDETQEIARSYQAQCTPDIYLLKPDMSLFYHGRIDDNWKDENNVNEKDLEAAVLACVNNKEFLATQYPSMGCSIKWRH